MSEHLPAPSRHEKAPQVNTPEKQQSIEHTRSSEHEHSAEHQPISAETARKAIAEQAVSSTETIASATEHSSDQPASTFGVQRELKADAYRRTIEHVQQQLPAPLRVFSKIVHSPRIEAASTAAAHTAARPSGILGGAIISLLGSIGLLYAAKHYGYEYNYALVFLLFAVGFLVGLLTEVAVRAMVRKR